jgi:phosphohistidine swiveling domain-containing protein
MYKPFTNPKYIEKMVRELDVISEQETLESSMLNWKGDPYFKNPYNSWVKYVSAMTDNPRELFLYWDRKTEDMFLEDITNGLLRDNKYFTKLVKYFFDSYSNFKKFTDELYEVSPEKYAKLSNSKLIQLFREFCYYHKRALAGYYVVYDLVNLLPRLVKKDLNSVASKLKIKDVEAEVTFLSTFGIISIAKAERIEFLKKLKLIKNIYKKKRNWKDKNISKIILEQWYDFGSCTSAHTGRTYTLKEYEKNFRKNINSNPKKEIAKISKEEKINKAILQKSLIKFKNYPEIIEHISWLRTMMGFRNNEEEFYYAYFSHCWSFFKEIIGRINLKNPNDFWLLSKQEIIGAIRGEIKAEKIAIERKIKGLTIKQVGNSIKVWTGIRKEDWHEQQINKNIREFRGVAAYRGRARGKAKIIFNPGTENRKFKKGDVLVTSMTTPDFVPLIKKAAAIVTDEGGLLCHASIVAREMKTICLISTKIATKVLHDGDLVEVDANHNKAKIIKRASCKKEYKYSKRRSASNTKMELMLGR